ncbi:hypothetical protein BaRGS_00011992 [Batillaria attramentaria]|uniref:EGF-like domain-containing protein n=1 Tax=Batillaria attramentaria TaxID=370345 RepID=A0ABD0LBY6_9CAEN
MSNFTVQTAPTNMSEVSLNLPGVTVVTLSGVKVGLLQSTERLELKLDLGPDADDLDVEYFEWAIGSSRGKDDVFPQTVVGTKNTTQVAIVDGYMKRDDLTQNVSIGDYTKKNYTSDSLPDPTANKFLMEPGRCLRQKLYGVSKGHVLTAVELTPVCIKRTLDVLLEADNTTHHLWQNGSAMSLDSAPTSAESLHATVKLSKGALLAGVIEQNDLEAQYGTSASAEFSPFIVLPDPANDQTLASMPGPHVFLSPIAEAEFAEDVEFNFTVPSDVDIPDDSFVMMVFWNPGTKRWETPKELCPLVTESYDKNTRVVSAQLCADVFNDQADPDAVARKRRSVDGWPHTQVEPVILGPRMVTVAVVQTSTVNLPPTVHKTSFTMLEDSGVYIFNIAYTDDEGDEVVFSLAKQPSHGIADVTEQGLVRYRPNPNFSGKDVIDVTGREELDPRALALGIVPNTVSFTITVLVSSVNDPPDIFYLPDNSNNTDITQELLVGPTAGNGINMSVLVEGNTTTQAVLGAFFFSDIDHDPVSFFDDKRLTPGADLTVEDLAADDIAKSGVKLADTSGVSGKRITLSLAEGYSGRAVYEARVKDTAGAYSMQLTLDVRVLLRPCFHGRCQPRLSTSACLDLERSLTFDPYVCKCDLGYEGQWCETETNECATGTCSPITDCVDLIGGYRCDYNPTKLAAIIVCSLLAALLGLFALYKLKKRKSKVGVWNVPEDFELKKVGRSACDSPLPNGSRSVSDADISLTAFVVGGVGSRKPAADTEFEFFKDPLFHYNPSQNPTAVQAPIASLAPNLTLPPAVATSSTHGKPPPSTKSPAKVKAPAAKPKPTGAKRPPSKNQGPSIRETDVTTETPSDDIKHGAADNEAFLQSHDDVKTKRPFSAGSRHSTVTAVVEENRLPKVEN